jgi:predicted nucleotidyltransferase
MGETLATRVEQPLISQAAIDEIVDRLVEEFKPEQVILFGSYAWGTPSPDSDVDLLVILDKSEQRAIEREIRAHICLQGLTTPKDILVRTREEVEYFKEVVASLEHQILSRGRVLYG